VTHHQRFFQLQRFNKSRHIFRHQIIAKRHGQRIGRRSDWKKAYVTLKEGQNLDFVGGAE
ncbi:50S ribosomal protein L23, partial [Salmonella sp. 741265122_HBA]|uniref:50S ribosomal protein L23 n=1 Tax=Salmonella sp. 741265122_HBA TaxID=3389042 RepID=UPI00397FAAC9